MRKQVTTLAKIEKSIAATIEETGFRPASANTNVKYGPLKNRLKWDSVNRFLARHADKNPDCGFTSLTTFIDKLVAEQKIPDAPHVPPAEKTKMPKPEKEYRNLSNARFDVLETLSNIIQTLAANGTITSRETVRFGPFTGKLWTSVNYHVKKYAAENPECGFTDIFSLMERHGIANSPDSKNLIVIRPDSLPELFWLMSAHYQFTGMTPPLESGFIRAEFVRASVEQINNDLRKGKLQGLRSIFGNKARPRNMEELISAVDALPPEDKASLNLRLE